MEYNEKLKQLRVQNNMSQDDLAEKLHVARQTVSKWEQGINEPDIYTLKQYAAIFNVSLDELVGDVEKVNKTPNKLRKASKALLIISTVFYVFCVIVVCILFRFLQNTIPAHYNSNWEIDRYGSKAEVFLHLLGFTPFYVLAIVTYLVGKHNLGTPLPNLEKSSFIVVFSIVVAVPVGYLAFVLAMTVPYLIKNSWVSFLWCILGAIELLVAIATHPKITPQNGIAGFRTNFTLTNPEAWKKVNGFASICMAVAAALIIAVNMIFISIWVALGSSMILFVALAITFIYHEVLRRKMKNIN